jgi:hypothetical protein
MPLTHRESVWLAIAASLACGQGAATAGGPIVEAAGAGSTDPGSGDPASAGSGAGGRSDGIAAGGSEGAIPDLGRADARGAAGVATGSTDASAVDAGVGEESLIPCLEFSEPVVVGAIDRIDLDQLSGLVASRARDGVLFAHEDSTGSPIIYALDATGHGLATFTLAGAPNTDWEDIAIGPGPDGVTDLFIADIGDNPVRTGGAARAEIAVIRLPEPAVTLGQSFAEAALSDFDVLRFTYPGGVHEAEALMVHPRTGELLIVTRSSSGDSRVYRAPASTPPDTPTVLEEIAQIAFDPNGQGALATAGDISPTGDRVLVRTYTNVYLWPVPPGATLDAAFRGPPQIIPWAVEPQGEAISFTADGRAWLAAGEQSPSIYRSEQACSP